MKELLDKFFKDKNGQIVIGQFPNVPIIGWFFFMILSHLPMLSEWSNELSYISSLSLFTWSYLELSQGVNYFRRLLGLTGILYIVLSKFI